MPSDQPTKILCDKIMKVWNVIDLVRAINTSFQDRTDCVSSMVDDFLVMYNDTHELKISEKNLEEYENVYYLVDVISYLRSALDEVFYEVSTDERICINVVLGKIECHLKSLVNLR